MGKRLFVSVGLDGLADDIAAVQERLKDAPGLRVTDPEQAHVTLKFLGDTDPDRLPELVEELDAAVNDAEVNPFTVTVGGIGVFPDIDYISVVWVGFREGGKQLAHLHETIEERMVAIGVDSDDHAFTPHATVARMDHAGGKELVQKRVRENDPDVGEVTIEEVRLTQSVLESDGPTYSTVDRFRL